MESVKKSIGERAQHKMEYERRVNERQIQTTEEKTDTSNALDASSVIIESNGTESKEQDTSSRSGNDAHVDDADIRPINNEEPMAEVQTTAEINIFATGQQHTEQPEFINEGEVDQNAEQCHDIRPLPAKLTDDKTIELSDQSLESENVCLKKIVAQFQKYFGKLEAHCINLELQLQMENNVLKSGQQSQFLKEKEHPSDTNVFTMKMEILLEPASNKLLVVVLQHTHNTNSETNKENVEDKVECVTKPEEWAPDEWYYEAELQDYNAWKVEEEQLAREQRLLQRAINRMEQKQELPRFNLFEDHSYEDESYYTDEENFEALDYEDAYLAFDQEKSPKFHF
ncbi:hypothetical protein Tco_0030720 [Tanacetum coccineum]